MAAIFFFCLNWFPFLSVSIPASAGTEFISLRAQRNEPKKRARSTGPAGCPRSAMLGRVGQARRPGSADLNQASCLIPPSRTTPLGGLEGGTNTSGVGADGVFSGSVCVASFL